MNGISGAARIDEFSLADTNELGDGLSDELRARVKREIEPGERLLRAARCDPPVEPLGAVFFAVSGIAFVLFGLGILFIMPPQTFQRFVDDSTTKAGLVCLGLACVLTICLATAWNSRRARRRTLTNSCYAITDRRAIVWSPEPFGDAIRVRALTRGQVTKLVRIERPDGSGHLELSEPHREFEFDYDHEYQRFKFEHVPDVRRVEQIVRNNLMKSEPGA